MTSARHACFDLVILGAGTAGISASASLRRLLPPSISIGIIDGCKYHYYQPAWTLSTVHLASFERNRRCIKDLIPRNVQLMNSNAKDISPISNSIILDDGLQITGLKQALENDEMVFTIYDAQYNQKGWNAISSYTADEPAIFTYPSNESFKCRGASSKIMFLSHDIFLRNTKNKQQTRFVTPKDFIFSVARYNKPLEDIANSKKIELVYGKELKQVDWKNKSISVVDVQSGEQSTMKYGLLHVTPEMWCPGVIRTCTDLTDQNGFVSINPSGFKHTRFANIYAMGDACNAPTSKTAAAVSDQLRTVIPAIVQNFLQVDGKLAPAPPKYTGYTACPLMCGSGKVVLAEFDYSKSPMETFPFEQDKPRRFLFPVIRYMMPWIYWNLFMKGYWFGPSRIRRIFHKLALKRLD